ncbi:hypothetical protein ACOZ4Y_02600 [Komagataeibacter rhaeticus]
MIREKIFPNGYTPQFLNKNESLQPPAIQLAIDVCVRSNKFAVDVIYALLTKVDEQDDKIRQLMREKERCQPTPPVQTPKSGAG